jgi:hypothetical protein
MINETTLSEPGRTESLISQALNEQANCVEELQRAVAELSVHMECVMPDGPPPPSRPSTAPGGSPDKMPPISLIRSRIDQNTEKIGAVVEIVNFVVARLEV